MALCNIFKKFSALTNPTFKVLSRTSSNNFNYIRTISSTAPALDKKGVKVSFVKPNGEKITVTGKVGESLLDVVVNHNVDLDGFGACEGTLTCSTCHLILKQEDYDRIHEKPTDEELDMLDLAYELSDTSRLGCQIILTKELDGLEVKIPATVNDQRNS